MGMEFDLSPVRSSTAALKLPMRKEVAMTRRTAVRTACRSSCVGWLMIRCVAQELIWTPSPYPYLIPTSTQEKGNL